MADLTPAATLRAAATLIRDTASNATPGPWTADEDEIRADCEWRLVAWTYIGDLAQARANAAWGALISPDKAEEIAAWLEESAADVAHTKTVRTRSIRLALDLAVKILGRTS